MSVGSSNRRALFVQLAKYVEGEADAASVGAALSAELWASGSDPVVDDLALAYAEFTSGDRTENWFRETVAHAISSRPRV